MCVYIYIYIERCIPTRIHNCVCIHTCMHTCMYIYIYIYIYTHIYVYIYIHMVESTPMTTSGSVDSCNYTAVGKHLGSNTLL